MSRGPGLRLQLGATVLGLFVLALGVAFAFSGAMVFEERGGVRGAIGEPWLETSAALLAARCDGAGDVGACLAGAFEDLPGGDRLRLVAKGEPAASEKGMMARTVPGTSFRIAAGGPLEGADARDRLRRGREVQLGVLAFSLLALGAIGVWILVRVVVRPVERLASRVVQAAPELLEDEVAGHQLGRLSTGVLSIRASLEAERARLARTSEDLAETERSLTAAEASLVRSEKLATVGRLAAGVAHEIGNPLGGLIGYLELLRPRLDDAATEAELVDGALIAAGRIDQTIRDLLDFSRPTTGEAVALDVGQVVDEAMRLVAVHPRGTRARISVGVSAPLDAWCDRRHLVQVLVNLLLNAADAMEDGGSVEVSLSAVDSDVIITIRDEGPGFPETNLDAIFEPFYTTKAPGQGTGLGLSICQNLVHGWGGRIWVENRTEGGAEVSFSVPRPSGDRPPEAP